MMWKNYHTVASVDEALTLLAEHGAKARIIAGGTDMMIELERHQRDNVSVLIDITRVAGLAEIVESDGWLHMGPLVTHNQVVGDSRMVKYGLPLAQASWEVGAPQIRNRATVAGNLITASPANDTITPLMAMGAVVRLASVAGERDVPLSEFYTGVRKTVMRDDEMLVRIAFPMMRDSQRGMFYKLGLRRAQAISVVNVATVLDFDGDIVTEAVITLGSVAPTIISLPDVAASLLGKTLSDAVIDEVSRAAGAVPKPIDDVRSTAEYRADMVRVLVARCLRQLREGRPEPSWGGHPAMLWGDNHGHTVVNEGVSHDEQTPIELTINGEKRVLTTGQDSSLLDLLRDHALLTGTKEGCGEGECGACTVYLDGAAVMSCMVPAPRAHGAEVTTVEGLADAERLHPIQEAFVEHGAVQCGFCTPGFLMSGAKLLEEHDHPTKQQIEQSISGNLCRCTGYYKIIKAFEDAGKTTREET